MSVAVVGGGPAGLLTASLMAARGESVTLIDEGINLGGHLTYDSYQVGGGESPAWLDELQSAVAASDVTVLAPAIAWAAFRIGDGFELAVNIANQERTVRASHLVSAVGTTDLPLVAAGATLPGVMTARAFRILLNRHGVIPGQRIMIVGGGADADRLRDLMVSAGCEVIAVIPAADIDLIGGEGGVESLRMRSGDRYDLDLVVIALGEIPDLQLPGMLGAERRYDPALGGWRAEREPGVEGLFLAGGALLGSADARDVVTSVIAVVDQVCGAGPGPRDAGLPITDGIFQQEAVR